MGASLSEPDPEPDRDGDGSDAVRASRAEPASTTRDARIPTCLAGGDSDVTQVVAWYGEVWRAKNTVRGTPGPPPADEPPVGLVRRRLKQFGVQWVLEFVEFGVMQGTAWQRKKGAWTLRVILGAMNVNAAIDRGEDSVFAVWKRTKELNRRYEAEERQRQEAKRLKPA
jgi:hypothetical protein